MSREAKYRAWDKVDKRMAEVLLIDWLNKLVDLDEGVIERDFEQIDLLQYTGLKDKNCVEIYEGDVLRDSESIVIVKFVSGEFSVDYRTMGGKWRNYGSLFDYLEDYEGEIIGNIYENPELLERSND